jgi:hypothetical protein
VNNEQADFLDQRIQEISSSQPEILTLKSRLLQLGGSHLVAPVAPDPDLEAILSHGFLQDGDVILEEMERNSCHWNVAALWLQKQANLIAVGTGYALSEDGLWRQHSWGIQSASILETTEERTHYFGLRLSGEDANRFASAYFSS